MLWLGCLAIRREVCEGCNEALRFVKKAEDAGFMLTEIRESLLSTESAGRPAANVCALASAIGTSQ